MQLLRLKCTRMHEASCRFPVVRLLLFVCRIPPTPTPIRGRTTMTGEWEDSEKMAGEKNRGRLGHLKTLSSRSHPPTGHLHSVWGLTLSWCCCLSVCRSFPDLHQQGGLSSFGKHRNAAWVKPFKKQLVTNYGRIPLVETSTCALQPDTQHSSVWHPLFRKSMAVCFLM